MSEIGVTPKLFDFLAELAAHNDRVWFQANKQRYLDDVRDPLLRLVSALAPAIRKLSPHMVADPRPVGGSLFRLQRDTRFAADKRPYKTHAGIAIRHAQGRDVHGPVFYLHLEPGNVFAGAGMWHPDSSSLQQVREAIVAKPKVWQKVLETTRLDDGGDGERLKRPPRGFDPQHPCVEDLKRKSFIASTPLRERDVCHRRFVDTFAATCAAQVPLMRFLTGATSLPW